MKYLSKDDNFKDIISKGKVLVDFYADWCGPCKMMAPIVDELAEEYAGSVKIGKLNVDDSPATSAKYKVMTIPTLLFVKNGEVVDTVIGVVSKSQLVEKINNFK